MLKTQNNTLLIVTAIIAMVGGLWLANTNQPNELTPPVIQGAIYPTAKTVHPFVLKNHQGETFTENNFKTHWSLIFVGYTQCPDICPTTLSLMAEVHNKMTRQNIQPPNIVFLSIDPERDTVELMKQYVEYFNPSFTGLTGNKDQIDNLSKNLNAVYRKAPGLNGKITKDDYLMDHSSALMLVNPDGNLQSILTAPHSVKTVVESIFSSQAYYKSLY